MKTNFLAALGAVIVGGHLSLASAAVPVKFSEPVQLNDLPPSVQRTINAQVGGAGIASIDRVTRNGVPLYQVRLKEGGKSQPIYVSETGSLITPDSIAGSKLAQDGSRKGHFNELPSPVQNTVRGQAGSARIDDIEVVTKNGQTNYNVAFKRDGKAVQLGVDPAGNILSGGRPAAALASAASATRVPLSAATKATLNELPAAAQNTLRAYTQGAQVEDIDKGTLQGRTVYEAAFKYKGQNTELRVAEDGSLIHDDVNDQYLAAIGKAHPTATIAPSSPNNPAAEPWKSAPERKPLSVASKVNFRDLPTAVRNTLRSYSGITRIEDIDKGTLEGKTVYEAAFKDRGRNIELRIAEDGSLIVDQPNGQFLSQSDRQFPASAVGQAPGWQGVSRSGTSSVSDANTLKFEQLPAAVQTALRTQAGAGAIENITQSTINGRAVYQATVQRDGRNLHVQVHEDGSLTK